MEMRGNRMGEIDIFTKINVAQICRQLDSIGMKNRERPGVRDHSA